jgi:two-component system chemotaxis sensor kinase CheA
MSGFDLVELLPFYLDETEEQVGTLNDALLRLERDPGEAGALQEAFRVAHTIKGAAGMLGFDEVKHLTHALEDYFATLRDGLRSLGRPELEACFRCLDALRDYHRDLRSGGKSQVDLAAPARAIRAVLEGSPTEDAASTPAGQAPTTAPPVEEAGRVGVTVTFVPGLAWRDLKAQLVLSRLSSRGRVLSTDPPVEELEKVASRLDRFTVWLAPDVDIEVLRVLADVDGVQQVQVHGDQGPEEVVSLSPEAAAEPASGGTGGSSTSADEGPSDALVDEPPVPPDRVLAREAPATAPSSAPTAAAPAVKGRIAETLRVDVDRLDRLMNLAGELVITKARSSQVLAELSELFREGDERRLAEDTWERLERLTRGLDAVRDGRINGNGQGDAFDRWSDQFQRLADDVKALLDRLGVIRQARDHLRAMGEAIDQLGRVSGGLQKGVLDTRMVPIGPLFERFRRVVRDLSVASGKDVLLEVHGEGTELDKRMIDELADPLIHMVRNAVDHGLEPPAAREAAGKPRAGTITLRAAHRGNSVIVTVGDDGRGIDAERLRRKVVGMGLVAEAEAASFSEARLIDFIWHPGLSTVEKVTDISGRGVGMDIVKSRIEGLNGSVDVWTTPGQGTTFTIRLPLTLAILPGLLLRIYDEWYALPLDAVSEIVEVGAGAVRRIHGKRMIEVRGRVLSLVELNDAFRWGGRDHPSLRDLKGTTGQGDAGPLTVVIARGHDSSVGLRVDELVGIQELVLKSLERNFRSIRGLSGASILGDGRVCLVLDLDALVAMVSESARSATPVAPHTRPVTVS